ncbi:hypothetical protein ACFFTM_13875 [Pseudoduganella plicata]|nr:hypothetical protein [Pseudoduganella plicata]QBQ35542.1 hypothetical protein E1742_04710 [Pseudoduganella plicata]
MRPYDDNRIPDANRLAWYSLAIGLLSFGVALLILNETFGGCGWRVGNCIGDVKWTLGIGGVIGTLTGLRSFVSSPWQRWLSCVALLVSGLAVAAACALNM